MAKSGSCIRAGKTQEFPGAAITHRVWTALKEAWGEHPWDNSSPGQHLVAPSRRLLPGEPPGASAWSWEVTPASWRLALGHAWVGRSVLPARG